MSRYTTRQKIDALSAAREWLGEYEGSDGKIAAGATGDIPADMIAAYEIMGEQIADLLRVETLTAIEREVRRINPQASKAEVAKHARLVLRRNPDLVPAVV